MFRLLALLLSTLAWQSVLAQTEGRVLAYPDAAEQRDASALIDLRVTHAVAMSDEDGDLKLFLLPAPVPFEDLDGALLSDQLFRHRLAALGQTHVDVSVRPARGEVSASVWSGDDDGPYLGTGALAGGRLEDGRLRGRMMLVSSDKGRALADVAVDAPLIKPAVMQELAADGGAPWQSLLRLRAALRAGDEAVLRALLVPNLAKDIPTGDAFQAELPTLRRQFPMDEPFERGWLTELDARLVLPSNNDGEPVRILVDMVREGDAWHMLGISYRRRDMALLPIETKPFVEHAGFDESPLGPGIAISTELDFDGLHLRPRHAIAMAIPGVPGNHWIFLSDAPVTRAQLLPAANTGSGEPEFPDLQADVLVLVARSDATTIATTGLLKQVPGREPSFESKFLGLDKLALIDGVFYGLIRDDEVHIRFAAPVH